MAKFHYCTLWFYKDKNGAVYTETFDHGDAFDDMMRDLHQEEWSGSFKSYNTNNKIEGYMCLLTGLKIQTDKGYIEKEYTDSMLLESLEIYQNEL